MTTHDLHNFMSQVSAEMASEYERISRNASCDPGTAGDEGEANWAGLLREWLPPGYHVETKGQLIAPDGTLSPQADVVVLKPSYPRKLLNKKKWLAGGVAAVFECKTTLRAVDVSDSVERCAKFKALIPTRTGSPYKELRSPLIYGLLAHSHVWKAAGSDPINNISRQFGLGPDRINHPRSQIDLICVTDLACWSNMYISYYEAQWSNNPEYMEAVFEGPVGVMSSMTCSAFSTENQVSGFQPVGTFLSQLWQRLAWEDASLREIADYYRLSGLWGSGQGAMIPWPRSVLTQQTAAGYGRPLHDNNDGWDEWQVGGF